MTTPKRPFHTASEADIKRGEVSDVYFARTVQILIHRGDRKRVKAEVYLKSLPEDWRWGILAGLEEAAALLEGGPWTCWRWTRAPCSSLTSRCSASRAPTSNGRSTKRPCSASSARRRGSRPRQRAARRPPAIGR